MSCGKMSGLARYLVDVLWDCHLSLYVLLAALFTKFARSGYLRVLSTLLWMLLFKLWGDCTSCDNYRGISLLHPVGAFLVNAMRHAYLPI